MQQRNPALVFFLSLITFGIYSLVWHVKTKNELNRLGAHIPTAWLLIVPLANLYWVWKYCEGVEQVTNGQISAVLALILLLLLSIVGIAILQSEYNKLNLQPAGPVPGSGMPPQPQATQSFSPPPTPFAAASPDSAPPPVGTPVFPTPPVGPTVNDPTGPVQPPATPPTLPPSPIQ
jgi:hypothetical protein